MASLKDQARKSKTVFSLDFPTANFLHPRWPGISPSASASVLAHLLTLISELKDLQPQQSSPSKLDKPPLLVGPNAVTAHLEHLVSFNGPSAIPSLKGKSSSGAVDKPTPRKALAIIVTRLDQPSQLHSHLPVLCSLASVPLITLSKNSEGKLVAALKPKNGKVYMIAVFDDTPGIEDLSAGLKREDGVPFGAVETPDALKSFAWKDTKSLATKTFVSEPRKRKTAPGTDKKGESKISVQGKKAKKGND